MLKKIHEEMIQDIGDGFTFREYETDFGDYDLKIVLNKERGLFDEGDILVYGQTCEMEFSMVMPLIYFTNETAEEFEERLNSAIYYMATEI